MPISNRSVSFIVADPIQAGNELTYTLAENQAFQLIAARFSFTTSATAADRLLSFNIDDSENVEEPTDARGSEIGAFRNAAIAAQRGFTLPAGAVQAASLTRQYHFISGLGSRNDTTFTSAGDLTIALPPRIILNPGWSIATSTANIATGDQYNSAVFYVETL